MFTYRMKSGDNETPRITIMTAPPLKVLQKCIHLHNGDLLIAINVKDSEQVVQDLLGVSACQHRENVHELHEVDVVVSVGVVHPEQMTL